MKLYVASGHFDLATPYFATQYTLAHMGLDPTQRQNIRTGEYEAGHMMYVDTSQLEKLKREVAGFIAGTLGGEK
jgi:carboxypeptidase C (cathepsin A)